MFSSQGFLSIIRKNNCCRHEIKDFFHPAHPKIFIYMNLHILCIIKITSSFRRRKAQVSFSARRDKVWWRKQPISKKKLETEWGPSWATVPDRCWKWGQCWVWRKKKMCQNKKAHKEEKGHIEKVETVKRGAKLAANERAKGGDDNFWRGD